MTFDLDARDAATALPTSADDGWDMPVRRRGHVMADLPDAFEPAEPDRPLPTSRGLLTPAEIEALLRPDLSDLPPEPDVQPAQHVVRDFAAAPALTSHDQDAGRRLAARLSLAMRESCGLPVAAMVSGIRRGAFEEAVRGGDGASGAAFACFASRSGDVGAVLVLAADFAQRLVETACGAQGRAGAAQPLSPIDLALLDALLRPLGPAISPDLHFSSLETEAVFAASIAPPGEALVSELSLRVQAGTFPAHLIVASTLTGLEAPAPAAPAASPASPARGALSTVLTARIASLAVPLSRLSGLKPGATLLLGIPADQPVELVTGGEGSVLAAEAEIGRRGNRVALRITRRGPALGGLTRPASS